MESIEKYYRIMQTIPAEDCLPHLKLYEGEIIDDFTPDTWPIKEGDYFIRDFNPTTPFAVTAERIGIKGSMYVITEGLDFEYFNASLPLLEWQAKGIIVEVPYNIYKTEDKLLRELHNLEFSLPKHYFEEKTKRRFGFFLTKAARKREEEWFSYVSERPRNYVKLLLDYQKQVIEPIHDRFGHSIQIAQAELSAKVQHFEQTYNETFFHIGDYYQDAYESGMITGIYPNQTAPQSPGLFSFVDPEAVPGSGEAQGCIMSLSVAIERLNKGEATLTLSNKNADIQAAAAQMIADCVAREIPSEDCDLEL